MHSVGSLEGRISGYENIRDGNLGAYHTYEEIVDELNQIHSDNKDITHIESIGKSNLKQEIYAIRISNNKQSDGKKPEVLYLGQIHAKEVISAEQALGVIHKLVDNYGDDEYVTSLVDSREIWVVPCVNPDGADIVAKEITAYGDSDQRKNVKVTGHPEDYSIEPNLGVDLNRNFSSGWRLSRFKNKINRFIKKFKSNWDDSYFQRILGLDNESIGASDDASDSDYSGKTPFSEPETQALKNFAEKHKFSTFASFHSYDNLIMYLPGYKTIPESEQSILREIANEMRNRQKHEQYHVVQFRDLENVTGSFEDWLYDKFGTKAFVFEIGKGFYGPGNFRDFNPPENDISYYVENNIDAALYLAEIAETKNDKIQIPLERLLFWRKK